VTSRPSRVRASFEYGPSYRVAAGSAAEVRAALALARAWTFVPPARLATAETLLDRVLAMLWRLTHPRPEIQGLRAQTSAAATSDAAFTRSRTA
jgi:type II secretory pathway component PulM